MLGTSLYSVFTEAGHKVISSDLKPLDPWTVELDIRDRRKVREMVKKSNPNFVINLAALTDLEYCELNKQEAYDTNGEAAVNVAKICKSLGIPMVHISTAGVFDGKKETPYVDDDTPNPINVYGKSKLMAEKEIPGILDAHFIFRAGWMMGSGDRDKKFVKKVTSLIDLGQEVLYGLVDKFGSPTYTLDLSRGVLNMVENSTDYGLYNMVAGGNCTRFDVARRIVDVLGLDEIDVIPVTGNFFDETFFAPRPTQEAMINRRLIEKGLNVMRPWGVCLTEYLKTYYVGKYEDKRKRKVVVKYDKRLNRAGGPLVSIVTTAYKNERFNEKYFDSVHEQTYKNVEVIFVDNQSPDATTEGARKMIRNGKVVTSAVNKGCAGGNNVGVIESSGKYIFLMGPDAWADEYCVEKLVEVAEKNENYICVPRQMTYDGENFISCGIAADLFGYPARTYTKDGKIQIRRAFYADGSGVFMTRENYLKVGMMDKETFLFAEDVDLSWKAHLLGMDVIPVPSAVVYHFSGGSVGTHGTVGEGKYETRYHRRFMAERNIIRNVLKNYSWWNVLWILPYYLTVNAAEMIAMVLTGQPGAIFNTYVKAYIWNAQNIKSTMAKRRFIQNTRTAPDFEVMKKMNFIPHKLYALLELGVPKITK